MDFLLNVRTKQTKKMQKILIIPNCIDYTRALSFGRIISQFRLVKYQSDSSEELLQSSELALIFHAVSKQLIQFICKLNYSQP